MHVADSDPPPSDSLRTRRSTRTRTRTTIAERLGAARPVPDRRPRVQQAIAPIDHDNLAIIRTSVREFLAEMATQLDAPGLRLLDVAPQDHEGARPHFPRAEVETLDIDPSSDATYIADLTADNSELIPSNTYDVVVCTEVLEHTLQPFTAVAEIRRMLKPGGYALVTTPFDFRIHGPLPDCWRFTEHGLRALFADYESVEVTGIDAPGRFLMPIHYRTLARK